MTEPFKSAYVIYKDGRAVKVVTARSYHCVGKQRQIYMSTGAVFSLNTLQQMPYKLHPGVTCRLIVKAD